MDEPCIYLGVKVKPGPIERFRIDNFTLDNTVETLKNEAEKKTNVPSSSLELIHHGKILKEKLTLQDSGVKNGEMVHVVKKKVAAAPSEPQQFSDAELTQLSTALRSLGCTPNSPGWTRAMQLVQEESVMNEILMAAPGLERDVVALSLVQEPELVAALGAGGSDLRAAARAHPTLPPALAALARAVRTAPPAPTPPPPSGFAYSLEALSEDEDADETEGEGARSPITQEQLAAALQAATDAARSPAAPDGLLRLLRAPPAAARSAQNSPASGSSRTLITPEMFSEAISEAISRASSARTNDTPMEHATEASSSGAWTGGGGGADGSAEELAPQLSRMHEMGLLDDALNVRALLICAGDVNAAINLVFSGAIGDD